MKISLLIIMVTSLVLSGCGLQKNDDFEKKVKCYGLGKDYVDRLQKEEDVKEKKMSNYYPNIYNIVMSVYSKEANTCILYFIEDKKDSSYEKIIDLLSSEFISIKARGSSDIDPYHNGVLSYLYNLQEEPKSKIPTE